MDVDEAADLMRENFVDNVEIPEKWEYISTEKLEQDYELDLDGYGFVSDDYMVFVDCRALPDNMTVVGLERDEGVIASVDTHLSDEAAETATKYMEQEFGFEPESYRI